VYYENYYEAPASLYYEASLPGSESGLRRDSDSEAECTVRREARFGVHGKARSRREAEFTRREAVDGRIRGREIGAGITKSGRVIRRSLTGPFWAGWPRPASLSGAQCGRP
jgi:hypothetical protein